MTSFEQRSARARAVAGDVFLSTREVEVLQLVADGLSNREIGDCLSISVETVKTHVQHVLGKLQARNRAHATAIAIRRGLIR